MDPRTTSAAQRLLLQNPSRRRIYEAIVARPGMHVRGLSRQLSMPLGSVEHHVRQLEKHQVVFCHQGSRRHTYYATGQVGQDDAPWLHALRKPVWARLACAMLACEDRGVKALAYHLGLPATTVSYNLRRMREAGLLERIRVGRESLYLLREPERVDRLLRDFRPDCEDPAPEAAFVGLLERAAPGAEPLVRLDVDTGTAADLLVPRR